MIGWQFLTVKTDNFPDHDNDVWQLRQRKLFQDDVLQVHGRPEVRERLYSRGNGQLYGQQSSRDTPGEKLTHFLINTIFLM